MWPRLYFDRETFSTLGIVLSEQTAMPFGRIALQCPLVQNFKLMLDPKCSPRWSIVSISSPFVRGRWDSSFLWNFLHSRPHTLVRPLGLVSVPARGLIPALDDLYSPSNPSRGSVSQLLEKQPHPVDFSNFPSSRIYHYSIVNIIFSFKINV